MSFGDEFQPSKRFFLDDEHRFTAPRRKADIEDRNKTFESVRQKVKQLSPATRRLLAALMKLLGGDWSEPKTRAEIAAFLGKKRLTPYDVVMLEKLCRYRLIYKRKSVKPLKNWRPQGYEFEYWFDDDVLWCLEYAQKKSLEKKKE